MLQVAILILPVHWLPIYAYVLPVALQAQAQVGMRAVVRIRERFYTGIISEIKAVAADELGQERSVLFLLDKQPIISERHLALWQWISAYYMIGLGQILVVALPRYYRTKIKMVLLFNEKSAAPAMSVLAQTVYLYFKEKKRLPYLEFTSVFKHKKAMEALRYLLDEDLLYLETQVEEGYRAVGVRAFCLSEAARINKAELLRQYAKKTAFSLFLQVFFSLYEKEQRPITRDELVKNVGKNIQRIIKELLEAGILIEETLTRRHLRVCRGREAAFVLPPLSVPQAQAFQALSEGFSACAAQLLWGVAASGKTYVYLHLIAQYLQRGQQVLFLVEKKAVTHFLIQFFRHYFGAAAVFYLPEQRGATESERYEIWQYILEGTPLLVVAAGGGIFLPFQNLGLVIIDDEHQTGWRVRTSYDVSLPIREMALYLAQQSGSHCLLGTATPSLETYAQVCAKKMPCVFLKEKFYSDTRTSVLLAQQSCVSKASAMQQVIGGALQKKINEVLAQKEQVILFQNALGYAPYLLCEGCGWVPQCRQCEVALTYFKYKHKLRCAYCATYYELPLSCPHCLAQRITEKKFGTERVEEIGSALWQDRAILRLDSEKIDSFKQYNEVLRQFLRQDAALLVATQMALNGLSFPYLGLVAVLDSDGLFRRASFRANEQAMQMLFQIKGRAGRLERPGAVLLQYRSARYLPLLDFVLKDDYEAFLKQEQAYRKRYFYPPFSRIIEVRIKSKEEIQAEKAGVWLRQALLEKLSEDKVLGPAPPPVAKIRNEYIRCILLKIPKQKFWQKEGRVWLTTLRENACRAFKDKSLVINFVADA